MRFYTIKEIKKIVDRTEPTIYAFMRTDTDFFYSHRETNGKGGYKYDEKAVERLKNHFCVSNVEVEDIIQSENEDVPNITALPSNDEKGRIAELMAELEAERAKNQALQANFETASKEIDDLKRENGFKSEEIQRLLLIIQQEKQEKAQIMLMLPPPRKTIGEKIKSLFTRKDTHERV